MSYGKTKRDKSSDRITKLWAYAFLGLIIGGLFRARRPTTEKQRKTANIEPLEDSDEVAAGELSKKIWIPLLFAGSIIAGTVGICCWWPLAQFPGKEAPIFVVSVLVTILALAAGSCWTVRTTNVHQRYTAEKNMATYIVLDDSAEGPRTKSKYEQIVKFWARACEYYLDASVHLSFMTLYLLFTVILLFAVILLLAVMSFAVLDTRPLLALAQVTLIVLALECAVPVAFSLLLFRGRKMGWFHKLSTRLCNSFPVLRVKDIRLSDDTRKLIHNSPCIQDTLESVGLRLSYSEPLKFGPDSD